MEDGALSHFNNVLAFDISELRVSRTQELVPGATVVVSGAESLPLDAESIDFAFSDQVIEHVPSDQLMVLELHRVLRLGGTAFVGSVVKKKFAFYFYRKNGEWRLDPTHIREYPSAAHMALLFETNGFSIDGIFERAIAYSARDLVTRLISRVCGLDSARAAKAYEVLSPLAHVRIRVPGYYHCWVRCRRI
jgi:ubiquinone/menaquinone biosynthesis C-methylase UbiE